MGHRKKKKQSPREESSLRPSGSALPCATTEPQRLYGEWSPMWCSYITCIHTYRYDQWCWFTNIVAWNPKVWDLIPHGDSTFFLCLMHETRWKTSFSTFNLYPQGVFTMWYEKGFSQINAEMKQMTLGMFERNPRRGTCQFLGVVP